MNEWRLTEQFPSVESYLGLHWFSLLRFVIGLENLHHPLNQSQPITTWSLSLSRVLGGSRDATLNSHWLLVTLSFVLIGRRDRFGFKTPKRNALCN